MAHGHARRLPSLLPIWRDVRSSRPESCHWIRPDRALPYLTHTLPDDPHPDWVSTVGRPLPRTEIKIVNPETGVIVPRGEIGEICARGYSIMKDYFDNPEATLSTIDFRGMAPYRRSRLA